ncbi:phosphoribosyltransferase family protein [Chitinophagaceae bacterium LB-8]|jgi:pyrimidine operon attenuation protein / uracil phosphoribosyltransferase|uniref:Phosphoribosyltransferase family protein n=1 Tax=Paraflavisolibacter caeni TaxID=2982496 RepID=A0A9X2XVH8_9BACT|nr:phosphoribosyltransferase family protein [Paraflavisolibacter caeni]MCU7549167.1 phosphoribosyltransferase family protein [Paraflavisolibacter caeni]
MKTELGTKNCILNAEAIKRRLRRMAIEVAESNTGETSIVIVGIASNGVIVASNLVDELKKIINVDIEFATIHLNKRQPMDVRVEGVDDFNDKIVIIVDDVANSGRTLLYALKPFLNFNPKKIQTLVLVERSHKMFPVFSDFVGLSLSTTLQDHITVETEGSTIIGAWLH